jgi:hypothetical protein
MFRGIGHPRNLIIKGRTESKKVKEKTEQISQKEGYMKYEIDPKTKKKTRVIISKL